ncbi:DUF721 domain-containing protein [Hydrogenophaga sp. PAMC20947]|nr:DUF721 domain-containing protein [Hydrogenophaga sp. PAMC20947]
MTSGKRIQTTFSLEEAADAAPSLGALRERIKASQWCLDQVRHLIPSTLRAHVKSGPLQEGEWCLLVGNAAASTKLRQLLPALQKELVRNGGQVTSIRLKVQSHAR